MREGNGDVKGFEICCAESGLAQTRHISLTAGNLTNGGVATPSWQLPAVRKYIRAHRRLDSWPLNPQLNPDANYSVQCGVAGFAIHRWLPVRTRLS